VWGWNPFGDKRDNQLPLSSDEEEKQNISSSSYTVSGVSRPIPRVAPKFLKWLRSRHGICREMGSMMQIGEHRNIIKLFEILELIQVSSPSSLVSLDLSFPRLGLENDALPGAGAGHWRRDVREDEGRTRKLGGDRKEIFQTASLRY
jgi:hypothetical protein